MIRLLRKELKMVLNPFACLFLLMSAMVMIPAYPYAIAFLYICFTIQISFQLAAENNDLEFSLLLPITRQEYMLGKVLLVTVIQLAQMIVAIPFALLSTFVINNTTGNITGLDANLSLFGTVLIGYGLMNIVFFALYGRTGKRFGWACVLGIITYLLTQVALELIIAFTPLASYLDGVQASTLWCRVGMLIVGLLVYFVCTVVAYKIARNRFAKANL